MTSRSPAVKRLMRELVDIQSNPCHEFTASPLESDIFEWHFTIRGPNEGGFQGGRYHGRMVFPTDYPFKPPDIYFLTPNGRFEIGKKICLSITSFHQEEWRPGDGALAALDYDEKARALLAIKSLQWSCVRCGQSNAGSLPDESVEAVRKIQAEPDIIMKMNLEKIVESVIETDRQARPGLQEETCVSSKVEEMEKERDVKSNVLSLTTIVEQNKDYDKIRTRRTPFATKTIPRVIPQPQTIHPLQSRLLLVLIAMLITFIVLKRIAIFLF